MLYKHKTLHFLPHATMPPALCIMLLLLAACADGMSAPPPALPDHVLKSAELARGMVNFSEAEAADTLGVIYLLTRPGQAEAEQTACAIRRLRTGLPSTRMQVYVFVGPNATRPRTDATVLPVPPAMRGELRSPLHPPCRCAGLF